MSAKHTPGPWTAQNDGRDIISIQHSNNDPGAISMTLAKVTARMTWRSQAEANASLIAAAPELLEAAQHLSGWIEVLLHALDTEMDGFVLELSNHETGASTTISLKEHFENASAAIAKAIG